MSEKAIAVIHSPLTPTVWDMINSIAKKAEASRDYGQREAQIAIKMAVAYEHRIPLTSALSSVYVIEDKPSLSPQLIWAKILIHPDFDGYEEERLEKDGKFYGWEITLKRKNGVQATRRFTMDDANRIIATKDGKTLAQKSNWQNYPEDVCYSRTMARAQKAVFADVTQGLYAADELGADITPDGEVVDAATWTVVAESPPQTPPKSDGGNGSNPKQESKAGEPVSAPVGAKQEAPATAETAAKEETSAPQINTVADILSAGFDVTAIQEAVTALKEAGQDVHFPPATSEECQQVMAKLQEVPSASD